MRDAASSVLAKVESQVESLAKEIKSPAVELLERSPTLDPQMELVVAETLHSFLNCRVCQLFVRTVDRVLDKSEELMDHYLPITEEEIGKDVRGEGGGSDVVAVGGRGGGTLDSSKDPARNSLSI